MKPSILIVEDDEAIRTDLKETFVRPLDEFKQRYGVEGFHVDTADTAAEASRLLTSARALTPYDILLLDLGLPETRDSHDFNNPDVGIRILQQDVNEEACTAVVVATAHGAKPAVLIDLIRTRAVYDFVQKPWDRKNQQVFESVIQAYLLGQRRLWQEVRRQRVERWLLVQACAQVADRMARVVSRGLEEVMAQAETLRDRVESHIPAKLTPGHPLTQNFDKLQDAISHTKSECARTRGSVSPGSGDFQKVILEPILKEILQELRSGFTSKKLRLHDPATCPFVVHTFSADIKAVIKEMVFSAVEASPDQGCVKIQFMQGSLGRTVDVTVADEGSQLDQEMCRRISRGDLVDREEERARGLSLAQRVARNIGVGLAPAATESGNVVTLRIPVTIHDQSAGDR